MMADFSDFSFKGAEPEAPKEEPKTEGPDFSGLSFKDLGESEPRPEVQPTQQPKVEEPQLSLKETPTEEPAQQRGMEIAQDYNWQGEPTSADFDTDEEDVVDFIRRRGMDIFEANLVNTIASGEASTGQELQGKQLIEQAAAGVGEDAGYLDKLWSSFALFNPLQTLITLATGNPLGAKDLGQKLESRGKAVREEASKDMQEVAEEADTTGKQIAMDVISSVGATAPALATVPFGSPMVTAVGMGSTAYFDTQQEAYEKTQSMARAKIAGAIDFAAETGFERLPLTTLFKMGESGNVLKTFLKFLVQEEGTELATTAVQDLNAKLMYDPEMTLEQALTNLQRTAMSTPFTAGAQATAMRGVMKAQDAAQQGVDKIVRKFTPPPYTKLDKEVVQTGAVAERFRKEVEGVQEELTQIMGQIAAEAYSPPEGKTRWEAESEINSRPRMFSSEGPVASEVKTRQFFEENSIYPTRGNERVSIDSMQPGEVLTSEQPKFYQEAVEKHKQGQQMVKRWRDTLDENATPQEIADVEEQIKRFMKPLEENLTSARKNEHLWHRRMAQAQKMVKAWVDKYAPDMKVVISDLKSPSSMGQALVPEGDLPVLISLNVEGQRVSAFLEGKKYKTEYHAPGAGVQDTLAHEFGHALLIREFNKQPVDVQQAIRNDWMKFLYAWRTEEFSSLAPDLQRSHATMFKKFQSEHNITSPRAARNVNFGFFTDYFPSFREFLAHRMSRAEGYGEISQRYSSVARKSVEKFWHNLPQSQRFDKSFDLFLKKLAGETKLAKAQADYTARVRRYRAALRAMRERHTTPLTAVIGGGASTVVPPDSGGPSGGRAGRTQRINSSVDKFNKIIDLTAGLTHITTMNPHIPGVTSYGAEAQEMWQDKARWTSRAMDVMREWASSKHLKSNAERERFSNFLFEADRKSEELGRKLDQDEMAELREEFGVSNDAYALAESIWNTFNEALTEVEAAIIDDLTTRMMEGNPLEAANTINEVRRDFRNMRNRNYMPHSRFGSYTITGFAQETMVLDDVEYKRGQTVFFGTYNTENEAMQARKALEKEFGSGVRFGVGMLEDSVRELIDLPPTLAKLLENKLDLTPKQQKELAELQATLAPGQSFRKRFVQRQGTPGYSTDSVRVFSDYMQKFAGHLSRIKHVPKLERSIELMKESALMIRQQGGNSVKREKLIRWYEEHLNYMLDPGNELTSIRAIGFMWYLGFNLKSAVVNATQIPMVTYPYLAQEYNDVSATAALSRATYAVTKAQFTEKGMNPDYVKAVDELIERGIIDESLATELAALAEGGFLARMPGGWAQKIGLTSPENTLRAQKFFEYGALMFQAVEKMNRRITAVAAYDLARKAGMDHDTAVNKAHEAVRETQYEYMRFNRPKMMRGPVLSNITMFWQYMTNTAWFLALNKQAAARYLILAFMFGGLEGIPFMSNFLDIADFVVKKFKEAAGWKDPKAGAREFLWDLTKDLDDNPMIGDVYDSHIFMNGYSSRVFGMYDISASVQMGRLIPGTEYLATDLNPRTEILGGMAQLSGATANIPIALGQAIWSDDPDVWKRAERALPSFAGAISGGIRMAVRGEETDRRGAEVADFNWPDDARSWAEVIGRTAGFPLTRVNEERDRRFASYDAIQYYTQRHNGLMRALNYAFDAEDQDRFDETLKRIEKFNETVPFAEMSIQSDSIVRSMEQAEKRRMMRETGLAEQEKYIQLQWDREERRKSSGEE